MDGAQLTRLENLAAGRDWIWLEGNHDLDALAGALANPFKRLPGRVVEALLQLVLVVGVLRLVVNLVAFAALRATGTPVGIVFYIWLGIYNVFVISQFWAFTNDLYTEGQGRRLFPFIGVGSSLGAWVGAEAAAAVGEASHRSGGCFRRRYCQCHLCSGPPTLWL